MKQDYIFYVLHFNSGIEQTKLELCETRNRRGATALLLCMLTRAK